MPRTCREDELLTKAQKIDRNDIEQYLTFREDLAGDISDYVKMMECYLKGTKFDKELVSEDQYKAAKFMFQFWTGELKDHKAILRQIDATLKYQRKQRLGDEDETPKEEQDAIDKSPNVSPLSTPVKFSKHASGE